MVTLPEAIAVLYPQAMLLRDYEVADDGSGPTLVFWNAAVLGAQPAQATLDAVTPAQVDAKQAQRRQAVIGAQTIRRTTANQSNSTTVLADIAELSFELAPHSHYKFRVVGGYASAVSTTGLSLAVNGPANPDWVSYAAQIATSGTAAAFGIGSVYNTTNTAPSSAPVAGTPLPFSIEGTISTGDAGGTFTPRFASEVGGSAVTILRGSFAELAAAA